MSRNTNPITPAPTSAVRNTGVRGKEAVLEDDDGPAPDTDLQDYFERNYDKILPIIAEKVHQEKNNKRSKKLKLTSLSKRCHSNPSPEHPPRGRILERKSKLSVL